MTGPDVVAELEVRLVLPDRRSQIERAAHRALPEAANRHQAGAQDLEQLLQADRAFDLDHAAEVHWLVGAFEKQTGGVERRQPSGLVHRLCTRQVGFGHPKPLLRARRKPSPPS